MSATTSPVIQDEFDTFTPQRRDPSDYLPIRDVAEDDRVSETQLSINDKKPFFQLPLESRQRSFEPDVSWEGVVLDVSGDSFNARLVDMNNPSQYEEAEILNTAVSDQDDIELIKPGAIFFWSIGRRIEGRRSEQVSWIQFRRLPVWTKSEILQSKQEATELYRKLGW